MALATSPEQGLAARLPALREGCIALWHGTPADLPPLGPAVTWHRQWSNARATARLIDEIVSGVEAYPDGDAARAAWREAVRGRLRAFGEARFGWPDGYRRLLFGDGFYESAVAFARRARAFDPALPLDDLLQALRNVWIANSLQGLCALPVTLTPRLFAYSMLYPATDNVLDGAEASGDAKRAFNASLGRRLMGDRVAPRDAAEAQVFALVAQIEDDLPRSRCRDGWTSILEIHRAQVASLRQHRGAPLSEEALLDLSVAKGGASVLADLYLVVADVAPEEERFAFGYGVFLQLLDDLQDVASDLDHGHQTLFTRAAREGRLDDLASRLARFVDAVLGTAPHGTTIEHDDCVDLIRRNCLSLLVAVVADQPHRFSRAFRRSVERQWPLTLGALRRLRRHAGRRYQATAQRLRRQHAVSSPFELLLRAPRS